MAVACAAVLALGGSAFAVPAAAAPPPAKLAPIVEFTLPPPPTEAAALLLEQASVDMMAYPEESAGSWYDPAKRQVVLAVKGHPTARFGAALSGYTDRGARVQQAGRSFADLREVQDAVMALRAVGGARISQAALDWRGNRVKVGLTPITDAAREKLAALFGDVIVVETATIATANEGPDRWRDRYPYYGGSAWGVQPENERHCSTAFAMKRPDNSKKFLLTAGHCHRPTARTAYTANTAATQWNVEIGTAQGYANSLCTDGNSCLIGSTRYGDITVIRVSGNAPYVYNGAPRATGRIAVVSEQTGHPAEGDSMCKSGATSGTTCGYTVVDNFMSLNYSNGTIVTPVVRTRNTSGTCTRLGDSGGAVYKPASGGARASGIHSGGTGSPLECDSYYTSIYYAQQLLAITTVTTSNW